MYCQKCRCSTRSLRCRAGPFNFDSLTGDYYEVVFAPTGQAYLNKFIQGQLTQVTAGTHRALGSNV